MTLLKRVLIFASALGVATALRASEHHGVVTFHSLPVPGAVVTAIQGDNKFTTSTGDDGVYSFRDLADGNWTVTVELTGFVKASREIGVTADAPAPTWELKLTPLAAPAGAAAAAGGRGAPQMTPEQARVRAAAQAAAQDQAQSRAAAVAATSGGGGGGDAILSGSLGGGGISAGNAVAGSKYNGNASFSLDNSVWDAIPFSLTGIQTPKASYAKGRINLSFGGPLKIPHLLTGKNGTFTMNYSMGRTRNATTSSVTVPTALERSGNFTQSVLEGPVIVNDPTTGQPFPGNQIPAPRLSGIALALENYYPQPNAPQSRLNYQRALVGVSNQDNLNARLNQTINKKNRLSGGIGWQRSNSANPNILGFTDDSSYYGVNTNVSWAHTYSKHLVQNLGFNFSRYRSLLSPYFSTLHQDIASELGIQGTSGLPLNWGPPNIGFTNFAGLTDGNASLSRNQTTGLNYGLSFVHNQHQFNFGSNYSRQQINPFSDANGRGSFNFSGSAPGPMGTSGYDFADFLLDLPAVASVRYGNADKYFRTFRFGAYAQDNWQISKALTANMGIRWDYTEPYSELYNRLANLELGPGFSTVTPVTAGQAPGLPNSLIRSDHGGISPSVGLAWRPFPKNTKTPTTVRLSFNQSHTIDAYSGIANNLSGQPPYAKALSIASTASIPLNMETAFLNSPATPNTYAVDPNYRLIVLTSAQLALSHNFLKGYYASAGLVYLRASHLDQTSLPNSLAPGLPVPVNGPPAGYIYEESNGRLQGTEDFFQVGRNMASGLSAFFYGMWARATDDGSLGFGSSNSVAQNWLDLNAEKGRSSLLTPFASGNWQYSTGQGKAGGTLLKGWKGALLKDWTFTNSFSYRAGNPLTATVAGAIAGGTGIANTLRADATGLSLAAPPGSGEAFNLAAFTTPPSGQWGTAGRNTIRGPATWGINGSLGRVFRLGERRSADLRFDASNILNHVVVNGWSTVVNAYNYGLPTGTQAMRSMTANLRFRF